MAIPSIANVDITDTFQVWLNTTNQLADIAKNKALTASLAGDTTTGNATLVGSFTANTIIAFNLLRADTFSSKSGGSSPISITSPLTANTGAVQTSLSLNSTLGPRTSFNSAVTTWNIGFENTTTNAFIISTSTAITPTVKITTAGEVIATKFTGQFEGVSATASKLATARSISITGDVTWSVIFDGSANVTSAGTIPAGSITDGKLRNGVATSVIGRSANSTGAVADISASADGQVLRRAGGVLGFGAVSLTAGVSGILPVANGGTGNSAFALGRIPYSNGTVLNPAGGLYWTEDSQRLGIGTVAPTTTLDINGTLRVTGASAFAGINGGATTLESLNVSGPVVLGSSLSVYTSIIAGGNITAFTTVSPSDIRLKENVETIESALDIVDRLRGVTFDWKDPKHGGKTYGLIAQEVEEVLPELVYQNEEFKGVAYANLVSVLIEAVKELRQELKMLKG